MRLLRDPILHFAVVLIVSPLFAMLGASLDRADYDVSTTLVGWLVTLSLWSGFGIRSVVYQWKAMPRKPQERRPGLSSVYIYSVLIYYLELRILIAIGLVTLFSIIAALIVCGLLIIEVTVQPYLSLRAIFAKQSPLLPPEDRNAGIASSQKTLLAMTPERLHN